MRITERRSGDAVVLEMNGPIVGRRAAAMLESVVRRLCRKGGCPVVADLSNVRSVDLAGLGTLVDAHLALRKANSVFVLTGVTRRIHDLVVITRLLTVFETYDSVEDAVRAKTAAFVGANSRSISALRLGTIHRALRGA
jgi:anti-sigma B factor antagonist